MTADPYHSKKLLSKHKYIGTVAKNIKLVCKYHNQNASQNRYGYSYGVKKKDHRKNWDCICITLKYYLRSLVILLFCLAYKFAAKAKSSNVSNSPWLCCSQSPNNSSSSFMNFVCCLWMSYPCPKSLQLRDDNRASRKSKSAKRYISFIWQIMDFQA